MITREALPADIAEMHCIRMAVKENALSNPMLITEADYTEYLTTRGKGWVAILNNDMAGFAIVDLQNSKIWALFVHPDFEKNGVGTNLQKAMLNWYFSKTGKTVWLSTSPATKAETFYQKTGWCNCGLLQNGETKFEMTRENWRNSQPAAF
ncbi:MAG: GNAT family N-acetyltransferase [Bacteroidota bacterium]